jgi:hypothetical protein
MVGLIAEDDDAEAASGRFKSLNSKFIQDQETIINNRLHETQKSWIDAEKDMPSQDHSGTLTGLPQLMASIPNRYGP